jgi:thymidylate kinase
MRRVEEFEIKPSDMEVRVRAAYKFFADEDAEKAYQVLVELHGEVENLTNEIQTIPTEIR